MIVSNEWIKIKFATVEKRNEPQSVAQRAKQAARNSKRSQQ